VRAAVEKMKEAGAEVVEVDVPGLEELLRDSSVIASEFKFDLAAFLASRNAPVQSLDDILSRGLYDASMEGTLTRRNAVQTRDTEEYRRALIKRDAIRHAVMAAMDEHRLVALLYPTLRRKPARIGETQLGTTCQLSAASGLPALTVPAGFTDDGLPIGVEFLGRAWSEVELLKVAFGWEQAAKLRRPPFSTPPLANGKAPAPVSLAIEAQGIAASFSYDRPTSELRFDIRTNEPRLIALHRGKKGGAGPIIARLAENGQTRAAGTVTLGHQDREALGSGDLFLRAYSPSQPGGGGDIRLVPAKP
jgi:hypothetical protein